jgi:cell filamentation protein
MYDAVTDDYCYPGTTVLKNKLDLQNGDELADFEAEVSDARADEEAPGGDLDFKHFKAIHHHLFQDVYDWAGEIRTVRISKGGNMFCFPEGNGRSQLSFFLLLADQAGYPIDLEDLEPDTFLNAMIASFDGDEEPLAAVILGLVEN